MYQVARRGAVKRGGKPSHTIHYTEHHIIVYRNIIVNIWTALIRYKRIHRVFYVRVSRSPNSTEYRTTY